ncbi:MAG: BMC domain-containing protein [Clostridia bacterium]|nr:BMC domain-containing protein [Clostridia bacterium]
MAEFSLGLVEVSALGNAIIMLDDMLKVADVEFVATERKLGGRLVTIVVKGELTAVQASVDAGVKRAKKCECYKASNVIARPHDEILKFLHLDEKEEKEANSEIAGTHVGKVPSSKAAAKTTAVAASSAKAEKKPSAKTTTKKAAPKKEAAKVEEKPKAAPKKRTTKKTAK